MKKLDSPTHTFSAAVMVVPITPTWKTPGEFMEAVRQGKNADTDPTRFKIIDNELNLDNRFGPFCVKYHLKTEDHGAALSGGAQFLILDIYGYACLHPQSSNLYFDIQYSERGKPDEIDPSLLKAGAQFIDTFRFTNIEGMK